MAALVAVATLATATAGTSPKTDPSIQAERCASLIRIFDDIVQSRYDHALLGIRNQTLDEARELRRRAAIDCAAGDLWFGVTAIEDALLKIGFVPWNTERRAFGPR